jgi:predicted aspartyl protease
VRLACFALLLSAWAPWAPATAAQQRGQRVVVQYPQKEPYRSMEEVQAGLPDSAYALPMRSWGQRIWIPVDFPGGVKADALLDTGSEMTLVNTARVGLKDVKLGGASQLQGSFAGGMGVQQAKVDWLKLGTLEMKNVSLGVVKHGPGHLLQDIDLVLGMDLMRTYRFSLDFKNKRMIFWKRGANLPPAGEGLERLALRLSRGVGDLGMRPHLMATVNGKAKANFLLDTGADGPTFVASANPEALGFDGNLTPFPNKHLLGPVAANLPIFSANYAEIQIGAWTVKDTPGILVVGGRNPSLSHMNILGTTFMQQFDTVHFDLTTQTLTLDRPKATE